MIDKADVGGKNEWVRNDLVMKQTNYKFRHFNASGNLEM